MKVSHKKNVSKKQQNFFILFLFDILRGFFCFVFNLLSFFSDSSKFNVTAMVGSTVGYF